MFNRNHSVANTFYGSLHVHETGDEMTVEKTKAELEAIPGATHLRVVSVVGEMKLLNPYFFKSIQVQSLITLKKKSSQLTIGTTSLQIMYSLN